MTAKTYEYQSDFAKRYVAQGEARGRAEGEARGRAEGEARGRAEGEARGVLTVLAARGIAVPDDVRARRGADARDVTLGGRRPRSALPGERE
jgi:hypothetical protein